MRRLPPPWPSLINDLVVGLVVAVTALAAVLPALPYRSADSGWYLKMATGFRQEVPAPFSGRLLHTGLAGTLHERGGLPVETAFLVIAVLATVCWVACTARLSRQAGRGPAVAVILSASWLVAATLRDATLPDALNAALLALALAVAVRSPWRALPIVMVAIVGRETSAVLALVLAVLAWRARDRRLALASLAAALAGLALVRVLAPAANTHALGAATYLLVKFPFNLARNLLGLEFWTNTLSYCEPVWVRELPPFLRRGAVDSIGFCGFNVIRPLTLLATWGGLFGVVPGWLWGRRREVAAAWPGAPLALRAALVYGLGLTLLAPAAGTALPRLVGYGWPAFWLAAPVLAGRLPVGRGPQLRLALLQLTTAIGLPLTVAVFPLSVPALLLAALAGVAANVWAARLARMR